MKTLKWVASIILAIIGICVAGAVGAILFLVGSFFGTIALGALAVILIVLTIQEYFEGKKQSGM